MTIESASYISQLDTTLPTAADLISEGDDHLRLTKTVLKTQFPNFGTTAIAASAAEVNYSVGVTSAIQSQLNSKGAIGGQAWTGAHSFAGDTSVPTLAAGTNTTGAASTAFVQADFLQKFPNYTAPVTASTTELNYLVGLTGAIQPQLSNQVAGPIHAATAKTTPADADELGIADSAASWVLKKLTFANLKAWISSLGGSGIANTPSGNISATTVQAAINELDSEKFDKSGGVISGNVSVAASVPAWGVAAIAATGAKAGSLWSNGVSGGVLHNAYFAAGYIPTYTSAGYAAHFGFNMSGAGGAALFVAPSGSAGAAVTFTEALTANSAGQITINSGLSFGYGAGSGGTATQTGSRTSGVALNKPSGQITLVSAAGTTAWQSFTVTNSAVASTDTPIVAQVSGTDLYEIHVTAVATGSFRLSFRTTGGTTTEQPVFKFEIYKGATS